MNTTKASKYSDNTVHTVPSRYRHMYFGLRANCYTNDEAFLIVTYEAARPPLRPFEDGDTVSFYCRTRCDESELVSQDFDESELVSQDFDVQVAYWKMRRAGESHRMADMLAHRSFPGIHGTNADFMKGTHIQDTQLDAYRHRMANDQGVDTNGKRYISGLAAFPGDPEAWVSGVSDVSPICANRGWNCHGAVEYEAPAVEAEKPKDIPIVPDIVQQHVSARLSEYDPREITPALTEEVTDYETRRLSGEIDGSPSLNVKDYSYEDSVRISEE